MDNIGAADEIAKLARLKEQGLLADKEFETQKRQLLGARKSRSLRDGGISIAVVAVVIAGLLLLASALAPSSPSKVAISTVALTQSQVQIAINYAMRQVGHSTYADRCLQLVSDAYSAAGIKIGSASDPIAYWSTNPNGYAEHSAPYGPYGSPPAGAILFWGQTQWSSDGHAAISLGNGTVVSSEAYPYVDGRSNGQVFPLSARSPKTYHYLGYIVPGTLRPTGAPPTGVAAPVVTTPKPANPIVSGQNPQPLGTTQLQPAAGAGALHGSGTVSPPQGGPTTQSSPPAPSSSTATTPPVTPPPATPPTPTSSPPPTYSETTGGVAHTWTDYGDAGGTEGPSISSNETVQIACKATGFAVADGNTWWYRIGSSPWSDAYYVSADAFYNNGATSGSLHGTPFVDPVVQNC